MPHFPLGWYIAFIVMWCCGAVVIGIAASIVYFVATFVIGLFS